MSARFSLKWLRFGAFIALMVTLLLVPSVGRATETGCSGAYYMGGVCDNINNPIQLMYDSGAACESNWVECIAAWCTYICGGVPDYYTGCINDEVWFTCKPVPGR